MAAGKCIVVYCGSALGKRPEYAEKAAGTWHQIRVTVCQYAIELGARLASYGVKVVFGGSSLGLLGVMANAARASGGETLGIVPELFISKCCNRTHCIYSIYYIQNGTTMWHAVKRSLSRTCTRARKWCLIWRVKRECAYNYITILQADGFIALPGGVGTMEELTEILTWYGIPLNILPRLLLLHN